LLKVMTIIGTRPEAIKMAPVIKELNDYPEEIESVVCATAQHREMLDQVLDIFEICPDYDLNLMQAGQSLSQLTARILTALDEVVVKEQPHWVLVQGDTTTVMVASLVAFYHRVSVGHVEAGLRTGDKRQPFPEEINRRVADVLADLYFAPTERNRGNLLREGVPPQAIAVTGNTVIDALMMTARRVRARPLDVPIGSIEGKRLILVTAHRRESFGIPLKSICRALKEIAHQYRDDVHIVYPVHLNPNVFRAVHEALDGVPNISLIEPVDYETFVGLMSRAYLILTDSGGIQEEAPSLGKPVLVLRQVTERPEVVALGAAKLVGTECETIVRETVQLLEDPLVYEEMASVENPYGDGRANQRIVQAILAHSRDTAGDIGEERPLSACLWTPSSRSC
jgi:UDP-N-acetylglucosamine 2-epimerase (non-hydrolysing)